MADSNGANHPNPAEQIMSEFGSNAAYVTSLYQEFLFSPQTLSFEWRQYFETLGNNGNGALRSLETVALPSAMLPTNVAVPVTPIVVNAPATIAKPVESNSSSTLANAKPLVGPAKKLAENMETSISVPTATSQRQIPLKLLDENRRVINDFLTAQRRNKVSYTHIIAWAIVQALVKNPRLNDGFATINGQPHRVQRAEINIGVAVDITKSDGSRALMVPNIKRANQLRPREFFQEYDNAVSGARKGTLPVTAYQDTTVSLTNPGTIGTTASNPRLMAGQGLIVATGAIEYPAQFHGLSDAALGQLGISKVSTFSSTYDHRVIQGAESGAFLAEIHSLLIGEKGFYEEIFADLGIPFPPVSWNSEYSPAVLTEDPATTQIEKQLRVQALIEAYRSLGHLAADVDPLKAPGALPRVLSLEEYGLTLWDLDQEFLCDGVGGKKRLPLRRILTLLRQIYCNRVGAEYTYLQDLTERKWLRERLENPVALPSATVRKQLLGKLIAAEQFERFLNTKYIGQKRFSSEGSETTIAIMDQLIEKAATQGVKEVFIGLAHRGRLSLLATVVGDFSERICSIFEGTVHPQFPYDKGDVKYHLGGKGERIAANGQPISVTVAPNPSHLEFVNPVITGLVRARQDEVGAQGTSQVLPVLLHGDAAFAGEGVVAETLNLCGLEAYRVGGTIHIVINNQIGFTTPCDQARSSTYATDVAKMIQAPIFHVNADDPDAAYQLMLLAMDYRQQFGKDIVIDLIGFRRHGHNEGDEPGYTQPVMYQKIKQHRGVAHLYSQQLIREQVITSADNDALIQQCNERYDAAYRSTKAIVEQQALLAAPSVVSNSVAFSEIVPTGINLETVGIVTRGLTELKAGFALNPKLKSVLTRRQAMGSGATPVDWSFAELLAFGSLALEHTRVRMSGQDCMRGTFTQRQGVYFDNETNQTWEPLNNLAPSQAPCRIYNSALSETAVMGFEYGYSVANQQALVLWEAQFGDFANVAQVIIDQFIAAGEEKWHQTNRLVLLLPHGYEGQGPEHSSARIERYLQLCAKENMRIAVCSTPAQYFHLLRLQVKQQAAKPLIVFTPKSLLRSPTATSALTDLLTGQFQPVLDDAKVGSADLVTRVIICSGKVYYDVLAAQPDATTTRVIRLEQYYPFPDNDLQRVLGRYPNIREVVWTQEEPANMGGWSFLQPLLTKVLPATASLSYAGRAAAASTATGNALKHEQEQKELVKVALGR
jgi:multifunctional 2-oxoglutarate metabolism enzyme